MVSKKQENLVNLWCFIRCPNTLIYFYIRLITSSKLFLIQLRQEMHLHFIPSLCLCLKNEKKQKNI